MDDLTIRNWTEMLGMASATTSVMTTWLGGIGMMDILLVSVTERTREIGLRMAVGARTRDVLPQFLVESVVLSGIGGLPGIALGAGGALALARYAGWPVILPLDAIATAVLFSSAVGAVFGCYPAWRASRLDPVEALRHE